MKTFIPMKYCLVVIAVGCVFCTYQYYVFHNKFADIEMKRKALEKEYADNNELIITFEHRQEEKFTLQERYEKTIQRFYNQQAISHELIDGIITGILIKNSVNLLSYTALYNEEKIPYMRYEFESSVQNMLHVLYDLTAQDKFYTFDSFLLSQSSEASLYIAFDIRILTYAF